MTAKTLLLAAALAISSTAALADDYKAGSIVIGHPWSRATPRGARVGAGYFTLTNTGSTPDRLVAATVAAAGHVELHEMATVDGVMRMRPVKDGIVIEPGKTVQLASGTFHLMMMDLKQQLQQGQHIKGTLKFEKAGPVDIEYEVEGIGGAPHAAPSGNSMQMNMH
jgi:hypothetical protein